MNSEPRPPPAAEPRIRPPDLDEGSVEPQRDGLRWFLLVAALASVVAAALLGQRSAEAPAVVERGPLTAEQRSRLPHFVALPAGPAVAAFAIGVTEVTVEQFRLFVERSGYRNPQWANFPCLGTANDLSWDRPGYLQAETFPVVCVSAADAMAYAGWLAEETGRPTRLPTEREWEYAARAGSRSRYWWGEDYDPEFADCNGCSERVRNHATYVGSWPANAWGLREVLGNVREWTCSGYAPAVGEDAGRCVATLEEATHLSVRGGSWQEPIEALSLGDRRPFAAHQRNVWTGFRVVQPLPAR